MRTEVLPKIRLHEFFQTDAEIAVSKFTQMIAEIGKLLKFRIKILSLRISF